MWILQEWIGVMAVSSEAEMETEFLIRWVFVARSREYRFRYKDISKLHNMPRIVLFFKINSE